MHVYCIHGIGLIYKPMNHCGGPLGIELEGQLWWLGLTRQEIVVWMDCSGLHDKQFGSQRSHKSALWRTSWLIWQFRGDLLTFKVDHDFIFLKLHFLRYLLFSGRGRYGFDFQWMRFMNHIHIYMVYCVPPIYGHVYGENVDKCW